MLLEYTQYTQLFDAKKQMEERVAKLFADLDKVPEAEWKAPACKTQ